MVAHICNANTQEAEAGGWLQAWASLGYTVRACLRKSNQPNKQNRESLRQTGRFPAVKGNTGREARGG